MAILNRIYAQRGEAFDLHTLVRRHFGFGAHIETHDNRFSVIPNTVVPMGKAAGFVTEVKKIGFKADWNNSKKEFNIVRASCVETAVVSKSVYYVMKRIFKTIEPMSSIGAVVPYGTNICHGIVANSIIRRGNNPEDKIWFYGASGGDVMHSVLSDENNRLITDSFKNNPKGWVWQRHEGYGKPGEMMDFLHVTTVGDLYDEFGM